MADRRWKFGGKAKADVEGRRAVKSRKVKGGKVGRWSTKSRAEGKENWSRRYRFKPFNATHPGGVSKCSLQVVGH
jgi:hypothetical protein